MQAGRVGGKGGGSDSSNLQSNNAMMGNTLTPDDTYAAAGLRLGNVGR
jgi:hypothetical protein